MCFGYVSYVFSEVDLKFETICKKIFQEYFPVILNFKRIIIVRITIKSTV